jgi:RecB family exonuclease
MHLTFGMYLDGSQWSNKDASSGELKLGPSGLLSLLETRLGLTGPTTHPAGRINQYMHRMEACDHTDMWFHVSFNADAWSTAKQMLSWRDELIEAGWKGDADGSSSPRLRALKKLEQTNLPLAMGREDRLQEVIRRIEHIDSIAVRKIQLQEPLELLPPVWQKVLAQLQDKGVNVEPIAAISHQPKSSNLASVQSVLSSETKDTSISDKDDSLILIKSADEWEAAENIAIWLAAKPEANQDVTIICGADTDVLDQALQRHGLPQLGSSESSRWRESLQILPLVLANAWKPVDIHRLVELLSLSMSPISGSAARRLLKALNEEPGVGGSAWEEALKEITGKREEALSKKESKDPKKEAAVFRSKLDAFLSTDRYAPDAGIPEDKLKERCQWVIDWLSWQFEKDPILIEPLSHAQEMQKLAEGKGNIPRVAVERMLDSVIGVGSSTPERFEQAGPWHVVNHPGQIIDPSSTVIWWGFIDTLLKPSVYWSRSEREGLLDHDIVLQDSSTLRSREAESWKRGFIHAQGHFLMFYPEQMHGENIYPHPFWDELRNAANKAQPGLTEDIITASLVRESSKLNKKGMWQLAGRKASLLKVTEAAQAKLTAMHSIPKNSIPLPSSLSYTQMSTLISCPMKWALHYHAKLRVPETLAVPTGNQMIGSFCHRIVQEIYSGKTKNWSPDDAEAKALELYDSMVEAMASELLLEGNEIENRRYRSAIGNAVKQLAAAIERLGLTADKAEERLEGDHAGIPFVGYADLLLHDKKGNPFVLDLKWSGSSGYRKDEVKEGRALQLASYAWMIRAASPKVSKVHSGYFMLAQGELISDSDLLDDEAIGSEHSLEEIWDMGTKSLDDRFSSLTKGQMEAAGVRDALRQAEEGLTRNKLLKICKTECKQQGLLYLGDLCNFCDFGVLCGRSGGQS